MEEDVNKIEWNNGSTMYYKDLDADERPAFRSLSGYDSCIDAYPSFGEMVLAKRKSMGRTQQEVAEIVGVSDSHISAIEKGKTFSDSKTVYELAVLFGLDVGQCYILTGCREAIPVLEREIAELEHRQCCANGLQYDDGGNAFCNRQEADSKFSDVVIDHAKDLENQLESEKGMVAFWQKKALMPNYMAIALCGLGGGISIVNILRILVF